MHVVPSSRGWFDETVCFLSDFVDTGDYSLTVSPGLAKETGEMVEKAKKEEKKNREKMENAIKSGSVCKKRSRLLQPESVHAVTRLM